MSIVNEYRERVGLNLKDSDEEMDCDEDDLQVQSVDKT